jgi:actin-related protein
MAFYARDSQIVILEPGDYKYQLGSADYLKLPALTALTAHSPGDMLIRLFTKYEINLQENDFPVLLLTKNETKDQLEQMIQILFEKLNVPALYLLDSSLAVLYGCGLVTGLVVDIGYKSTTICPVLDNHVQIPSKVVLPIGAKDIDNQIKKHIKLEGLELLKFKKACLVCRTGVDKIEDTSFHGKPVGFWRSSCIDVLFDPMLGGKRTMSIQEGIYEAVTAACEPPKRVMLWENIVLTGGSSQIPGIMF